MEQSYRDFRNNPYSPKPTHRFRVAMRKMRSLLHFVKPLIGEESYDELNTSIRDASQRLEPLREADVLIAFCGERAFEEPDLIPNYQKVFQYLHNERRRWMRSRLTKSMVSAFEHMIEGTNASINQLTFDNDKSDGGNWEYFLEKRFTSRKKNVLKKFKDLDRSDHKAAHEVRKQAKKLRYATKAYKDFLPSKDIKQTKEKLKTIQNELGEIIDLYTNSEWLEGYSKRAKEQPLKKAFTTLADSQVLQKEDVIAENAEVKE